MAKKQETKTKKKSGFIKKVIFSFLFIAIIGGGFAAYYGYKAIYKPNVTLNGKKSTYFYIKTGSDFNTVLADLYENNYIVNRASFEWLAEQKKYKNAVKPGRYKLKANMSNNELINLLRSGNQEPVKVIFSNARYKEDLAGKACRNIEADSTELIDLLNSDEYTNKIGFTPENILAVFIPNTYEFFWNTNAEEFMKRMTKEYKAFWTDERKQKANSIGLSQTEVAILASIVQQESLVSSEKPTIAGVYINRLNKGMLLQADPTVIYAIGDYTIRRVLLEHLKYDSPYNTYKYKGLPPGPICLPSASSIDAVLNYKRHEYIYFCAKEDFSGSHNFAKSAEQHNANARKFQQAMNKRKIMR